MHVCIDSMYIRLVSAETISGGKRPERVDIFPGTGVMGGPEPQCKCWLLSPGPLQEQQVLGSAEPSLQPFRCGFVKGKHVLTRGIITSYNDSRIFKKWGIKHPNIAKKQ